MPTNSCPHPTFESKRIGSFLRLAGFQHPQKQGYDFQQIQRKLCVSQRINPQPTPPDMKYHRLFAALAATSTILLFDCSKKNDPAPSLTGTWKETSNSTIGCTDTSANQPETACSNCFTLTFTTTTWTVNGSPPSAGTYTTSGSSITIVPATGGSTTFTYALTATTLTLTFDGGAGNGNCKSVTKLTRQ
jgi:hypothetical protein